jgi:diaminopimelate decarboxylase
MFERYRTMAIERSIDALSQEVQLPCYLYFEDAIRQRYADLQGLVPGVRIFYSMKANPNPEVCGIIRALGAGIEVSSAGEARIARDSGFRPNSTLVTGPCKGESLLKYAVSADVMAVTAESLSELSAIDDMALALDRPVSVMLRVNPRISHGDSLELMAGGPSQFGIDEESLPGVLSLSLRRASLVGIQLYAASQLLDASAICANSSEAMRIAQMLSAHRVNIRFVDMGGGFGVPYGEGDPDLDLGYISSQCGDQWKEFVSRHGGSPTGIFESGRYLVAESGVYLCRVVDVKESRGQLYVLTDGGMHQFARPALTGVQHPVVLVNRTDQNPCRRATIVGRLCTPLDVLARGAMIPSPQPGDIVAIFIAGAYGASMGMARFLSHSAATEYLVDAKGCVRCVNHPCKVV